MMTPAHSAALCKACQAALSSESSSISSSSGTSSGSSSKTSSHTLKSYFTTSLRGTQILPENHSCHSSKSMAPAPVLLFFSALQRMRIGYLFVSRVIIFSTIPTEIPIFQDIHIDLPTAPELPAVLPFLCSDKSESDPEFELANKLPERHVSLKLYDDVVSRWRDKVRFHPSSPLGSSSPDTTIPSVDILVTPISPASSTEIATVSPACDTLTPVITASPAVRSRILMRFLALGWHLEEIHVTWAHLEKKQTRLRLYTKNHEELFIQSLETASQP
ncbi:hypothetical protein Tco_1569524 [Tanacetum coccineum]